MMSETTNLCGGADPVARTKADPNRSYREDALVERIERLEECLREVRRDIEESADDVVWMRGGIETVCDRITAALGDQHGQS